jgi:hypothetical protein
LRGELQVKSVTDYVESKVGRVVEVGRDYFDVEVLDYASIGRLRGLGCCGGLLNVTFPLCVLRRHHRGLGRNPRGFRHRAGSSSHKSEEERCALRREEGPIEELGKRSLF